jgi:hypothetical protein
MALHGRQQHYQPLFFRQLLQRAIELPLKFGVVAVVRGAARILKHPLRFALLPSLEGAQPIQRDAKTDAHQPGAEARLSRSRSKR